MKKGHLHNFDVLRIVFAVAIVLFHVLYGGGFAWKVEHVKFFSGAPLIVQCFFIIAGFFLARSFRVRDREYIVFVRDKIARLWPVLFLSVVWMMVVGGLNGTQFIMNSLFLQCIGFTNQYRGITWYVSPLFWGLLFYGGLYKAIRDDARRNVCFGVIVYILYLLSLLGTKFGFGRDFAFSFVPMGFAQGLAGIGAGALTFEFCNSINVGAKKASKVWFRLTYTVIELLCIATLVANIFNINWAARTSFVIVPAMAVLLVCFYAQFGYVSSLLNKPILGSAGKYSYAIYVMQPVGLYYLGKCHGFLYPKCGGELGGIAVYTLALVLLGVCTYHLVEKPFKTVVQSFLTLERE